MHQFFSSLKKSSGGLATPVIVGMLALIALLLLLIYYVFMSLMPPATTSLTVMAPESFDGYVIPGVPYEGIYTYQGNASVLSPALAPLASVFQYWGGTGGFERLGSDMRLVTYPLYEDLREMQTIVNEFNTISATLAQLSLDELGQYLNADERTPLIISLRVNDVPIFIDPGPVAYPTVLIGINNDAKELTFHSYWYGPNYTMSFADFLTRQNITADEKFEVLVVEPAYKQQFLAEGVGLTEEVYPPRTPLMDRLIPMLTMYINGYTFYYTTEEGTANVAAAIPYLLNVITDEDYEEFMPRFFKVSILTLLAQAHLDLDELDQAMSYIDQAESFNVDIEVPVGDWPGVYMTQNSPEYPGTLSKVARTRGDIMLAKGDREGAKAQYEQALKIMPDNLLAKRRLDNL